MNKHLAIERAENILYATEWEGDMRVNMTTIIGAGRVMMKRVGELEREKNELLDALRELHDFSERCTFSRLNYADRSTAAFQKAAELLKRLEDGQ